MPFIERDKERWNLDLRITDLPDSCCLPNAASFGSCCARLSSYRVISHEELDNLLRQTLLLIACLSLESKLIFPPYNDPKLSHEVPMNIMFNLPTEFPSVADSTIFDPKQAAQRHAVSRIYSFRLYL